MNRWASCLLIDNPDPTLQSAKRLDLRPCADGNCQITHTQIERFRSGKMIQLGCSRRAPSGTHVAPDVEARALARHPNRSIQGATCKSSVVSYSANDFEALP